MKKIIICVLIAILGVLLCSCEVYVNREDVGKYYFYEDGAKTDKWIEFKNNRLQWRDSDGNHGSVSSGNGWGQVLLKGRINADSGEAEPFYVGYLNRGAFSFRKTADFAVGKHLCQDYYSDKSEAKYKDSGAYALREVVYSTEVPQGASISEIYSSIRHVYTANDYCVFDENVNGQEEYETKNGALVMTFRVRDCDGTKELGKRLVSDASKTFFTIKNGEETVFTAEDFFGSIDKRSFYVEETPQLVFYVKESVSAKIAAIYAETPAPVLKAFVYDKYVCDVPALNEAGEITSSFTISGEDVCLLAKDMLFAENGMRLLLISDNRLD